MSATKQLSRREALKTLAAAGGAVSLAHLPERWAAPVIETGTLPAHAQSSGIDLSGTYVIRSVRQLTACENMGKHHIFARVQDQNGHGINGIELKFQWADTPDGFVVIPTTTAVYLDGVTRDGVAIFSMFKGWYVVSPVNVAGQTSTPFTADYGVDEYCGGDLGNSLYHVSFEIVFEKWQG